MIDNYAPCEACKNDFIEKIKDQQDATPEFNKFLDENFWELLA